ncbi:helix-turn-helix domain-containing protein [Paenibacillus sp. CC-CFT747]|nr:helix-turn-helix domain-containing protein [Paenibacillus sp. CC-CFT747]
MFSCRSGDIAILKPGTPHDYEAAEGEGWEFVWAHFVPPPYWGRAVQLPEEENGLIFLALEDEALHRRILQAFERLILDARTWKGGEELAMNGLHEVFLLLSRKFSAREGPVLDERVEKVLQRMTESLQEPHSVASLAEEVHLSASRLAHLFKEQMGDSLMETLLQLRLRHAAKLLAFTRRPVSEIAESVGFASPFTSPSSSGPSTAAPDPLPQGTVFMREARLKTGRKRHVRTKRKDR